MGTYTGTDGNDVMVWGYVTPGVASDPPGTSPSDASDTLTGLGGDDLLLGYGGNDSLDGGSGNDALIEERGDDVLHGGDGNDLLISGIGNDTLDGGPGNDLIYGDTGTDTLTGGPGADAFYTFDGDVITDFNPAEGDVLNNVSIWPSILGELPSFLHDLLT